jgi:hypothetical protein
MTKMKDPRDVAASIQRSIETSQKGSRRVRCHTLRDLFGFGAWTAQRKDLVASLLGGLGIHADPPITESDLHGWIVLSLPLLPPKASEVPSNRPDAAWFEHMTTMRLDSEREVEMFFASPLFHGLGWDSEYEAAGFRFDMYEGVTRRKAEADLVYFADDTHSLEGGTPLVLVEVKGADQKPDAGTGQAQSYAYWLKPAYYVITNGEMITVWNYQGGPVRDVKVMDIKRAELEGRFDELYRTLSPEAALKAWQVKQEKIKNLPPNQ